MARPRTSAVVWLRRACQTFFVLLFLYLFLQTVYKPINETGRGITLFFQLDPLTGLSSGLGAWSDRRPGCCSARLTLVVTLLAGRWFCGWVCPFGALHNLFTGLRPQSCQGPDRDGRRTPAGRRPSTIVLAGTAGRLPVRPEPRRACSIPSRSSTARLAIVVFPAFNDAVTSVFTWVYQADPAIGALKVTALTEPVYEVLRRHVLAASQPHYSGTLLIAVLFVGVLAPELPSRTLLVPVHLPAGRAARDRREEPAGAAAAERRRVQRLRPVRRRLPGRREPRRARTPGSRPSASTA